MNRVFYIFRHGETDWNKERRCQGHTNTSLNAKGLRQAKLLASVLKEVPLEIIISSDLERANKTGFTVSEIKKIPLVLDSRLREMSYGEAEGKLFGEAVAEFGEELWKKLQSFRKEHDDVGFPGGETRKGARERFLNVLEDYILNSSYQHIGISTHGGALRNVLHYFLPEDQPILPIPNCVVYRLDYNFLEKKFSCQAEPYLVIQDDH
jgi:probable phosphoglycerate mutase